MAVSSGRHDLEWSIVNMGRRPLVSVIISVYNAEPYIDACLESVCGQTCRNLEILLMVGRCTDNSLQKCVEWQRRDDRIVIASRRDEGLGDARNYGFDLAAGEYLAYVDADDYVEPTFIEKLLEPLERDDAVTLSCCGFDRLVAPGVFAEGWVPEGPALTAADFREYRSRVCYGVAWLKMYRRAWMLEHRIRMFYGCHEDDAMHMCLAATVHSVFFVQEALYHYNVGNAGSLMHGRRHLRELIPAYRFAFSYLQKEGLYEAVRADLRREIGESELFRSSMARSAEAGLPAEDTGAFLAEYFPEIAEEMTVRREYRETGGAVLFCSGRVCEEAVRLLRGCGASDFSYVVDNNPSRWGGSVAGIPIVPFSHLAEDADSGQIAVCSNLYYYEVAKQLRDHGMFHYELWSDFFLRKLFERRAPQRVILWNTPTHTNVGDHAIAECEKRLLEEALPGCQIIEITEYLYGNFKSRLPRYIEDDDILAVTGGGFLGTLWMKGGENVVREILSAYPGNRILIFPQTMWFEETERGEQARAASKFFYGQAAHLTLMLREHRSYETAEELLNAGVTRLETPDIVLLQPGYGGGVCGDAGGLCLKTDIESALREEDRLRIERALSAVTARVRRTSMHAKTAISVEEREDAIGEKVRELQGYRAVVTDALHCMIFCALCGTPCVALDNVSKKLSGVYRWIRDLPYIAFAESAEEVGACLREVLRAEDRRYTFPWEAHRERMIGHIQKAAERLER